MLDPEDRCKAVSGVVLEVLHDDDDSAGASAVLSQLRFQYLGRTKRRVTARMTQHTTTAPRTTPAIAAGGNAFLDVEDSFVCVDMRLGASADPVDSAGTLDCNDDDASDGNPSPG